MALADDIISELRKKPGLTVAEITLHLFGRRYPYANAVRLQCTRLVDAGRLERRGRGGTRHPITYYLPRATDSDE